MDKYISSRTDYQATKKRLTVQNGTIIYHRRDQSFLQYPTSPCHCQSKYNVSIYYGQLMEFLQSFREGF